MNERFACSRCTMCCTASGSPVEDPSFRRVRQLLASRQGLLWAPSDDAHGVLLFNDEVEMLRRHASMHDVAFNPVPLLYCVDERSARVVVLAWRFGSPTCPFLDDGVCSAHGVRPLVCRSFPLVKSPASPCYEVSRRCPAARGVDVSRYPDELGALQRADARMTELFRMYEALVASGFMHPRRLDGDDGVFSGAVVPRVVCIKDVVAASRGALPQSTH